MRLTLIVCFLFLVAGPALACGEPAACPPPAQVKACGRPPAQQQACLPSPRCGTAVVPEEASVRKPSYFGLPFGHAGDLALAVLLSCLVAGLNYVGHQAFETWPTPGVGVLRAG